MRRLTKFARLRRKREMSVTLPRRDRGIIWKVVARGLVASVFVVILLELLGICGTACCLYVGFGKM